MRRHVRAGAVQPCAALCGAWRGAICRRGLIPGGKVECFQRREGGLENNFVLFCGQLDFELCCHGNRMLKKGWRALQRARFFASLRMTGFWRGEGRGRGAKGEDEGQGRLGRRALQRARFFASLRMTGFWRGEGRGRGGKGKDEGQGRRGRRALQRARFFASLRMTGVWRGEGRGRGAKGKDEGQGRRGRRAF